MKILERQKKLFEVLEIKGTDAFFSTNPSNVRYFTNVIANRYPERSVYFLATKDKFYVLTYPLEIESVKSEAKNCEIIELRSNIKLEEILEKILGKDAKLGVEYTTLSYFLGERLATKFKLEDLSREIAKIRAIKDEEEINEIKKAIEKTERTLEKVKELINSSKITEKEAALKCMKLLIENGCEWFAFEPIIASGENGAFPHAIPTDKPIKENTFTIVDIGGRDKAGGYCADITRTFAKGKISEEDRKIFEVVKEALLSAIDSIYEGVKAKEVDGIARKILSKYRLEKYFNHGLGHGLGLDVHEYPSVNSASEDILLSGYVITIEPGVYLPGKYGIRLEQDVVVRKNKAEILTEFPLDY
jgi:Xaa-Pro aminopeptidase